MFCTLDFISVSVSTLTIIFCCAHILENDTFNWPWVKTGCCRWILILSKVCICVLFIVIKIRKLYRKLDPVWHEKNVTITEIQFGFRDKFYKASVIIKDTSILYLWSYTHSCMFCCTTLEKLCNHIKMATIFKSMGRHTKRFEFINSIGWF